MVRRRSSFVSRHPFVALGVILAVELTAVATLHLTLGWSPVAIALGGLAVLALVTFLMG